MKYNEITDAKRAGPPARRVCGRGVAEDQAKKRVEEIVNKLISKQGE